MTPEHVSLLCGIAIGIYLGGFITTTIFGFLDECKAYSPWFVASYRVVTMGFFWPFLVIILIAAATGGDAHKEKGNNEDH